jgi:hypothetical protein
MSIAVAQTLWAIIAAYLGVGLLLALVLLGGAIKRVDPQAAVAPLRVRAGLLPGLAVLWPVFLLKLIKRETPEDVR